MGNDCSFSLPVVSRIAAMRTYLAIARVGFAKQASTVTSLVRTEVTATEW
jgi:hypothetical protein